MGGRAESQLGQKEADVPDVVPRSIVDTHAHLADPAFEGDLEAVLDRARQAGVEAVVAVSEDYEDAERVLALARSHPMLRPALGLYPGRAAPGRADRVVWLIRERRAELVGIGEVGLDHWLAKDEEARGEQRRSLERFVDLALELDLPLNVHSRSAGREVIDLLVARGARRVQLHAFDGRASTAQAAVEAGFLFSVPPSIVRSQQKRKLLRRLPLECLLLESDSPVLGPVAGERNEPAKVLDAAREVALLKGIALEEVLLAAAANTRRLYGDLAGSRG
jgi:TatD DNase family protein